MNSLILFSGLILTFLCFSCIDEPEAKLYHEQQNSLGEGVLWDHKHQTLYWIDITEGFVFEKQKDKITEYAMHKQIGSLSPIDNKRLIVALEDGIYMFDKTTQELTLLCNPPENDNTIRFNDGKTSPAGRFWVGTMHMRGQKNKGALYRMDHDGTCQKILEKISISNGITWSPCQTKMYYIDTPTRNILVFDYNKESGNISNGEILSSIGNSLGFPDGMTIDANGNLWIAMWGGASITHWDGKSGRLIKTVKVPAKNVTSCSFGGENLDTLFISTASIDMSEDDVQEYPLSGSIFYYLPKTGGIPNYTFLYNADQD